MKKRTFIILIAVALIFIWGHSLIPSEGSSQESAGITKILQSILDFLNINVTLKEAVVRKIAHFSEHTVAGLILGFFMYPGVFRAETKRERIERIFLPLIIGFFIGFMDETIQIFTKRGPRIQDVWIDFSGIALGAGISLLVLWIIHRRKKEG